MHIYNARRTRELVSIQHTTLAARVVLRARMHLLGVDTTVVLIHVHKVTRSNRTTYNRTCVHMYMYSIQQVSLFRPIFQWRA